ncbi:MAG: nucleotidyltransferase family protein [Candidatus Omnitrophica bacterium]|nr:nucleotidyltransferase family protein [Candidatus Omnitrophota bacterium]
MLNRKKIIEVLKKERPFLADRFGVRKIAIFGSFAKGVPTKNSDIDIFVEFDKPLGLRFMDFADFLEKILGCKADILTSQGIRGIRIKQVAQRIRRELHYV